MAGTLKRHAQTYAGIAQGAGMEQQPTLWPGLNEFDSDALIATIGQYVTVDEKLSTTAILETAAQMRLSGGESIRALQAPLVEA